MGRGEAHSYTVEVHWRGNLGQGTSGYQAYSRDHEIMVPGKPVVPGSADPAFRGDSARYNPEELLVASLSACHMLWYLHLCAEAGITVTDYVDEAYGEMTVTGSGGGRFVEVVLRPRVVMNPSADQALALRLHGQAHELCFIANSVNFPVRCEPAIVVSDTPV